MNTKQFEGKLNQLQGDVEKAIGKTFNNDKLKNAGTKNKIKGEIQEELGDAQEKIQAGLENLKEKEQSAKEELSNKVEEIKESLSNKAEQVKEDLGNKAEELKLKVKESINKQ